MLKGLVLSISNPHYSVMRKINNAHIWYLYPFEQTEKNIREQFCNYSSKEVPRIY